MQPFRCPPPSCKNTLLPRPVRETALPAEAKPLFRPDALRPRLDAFSLPTRVEALRDKLKRWADMLISARAETLKERELLPDFLTDFFQGILGYTGPADAADHYTISREKHVEVDGKFADAVLGNFTDRRQQFIVGLRPWPKKSSNCIGNGLAVKYFSWAAFNGLMPWSICHPQLTGPATPASSRTWPLGVHPEGSEPPSKAMMARNLSNPIPTRP